MKTIPRKIEVKVVNPLMGKTISLPKYATEGAAGIDIRACIAEPLVIHPEETKLIGSGIAINIGEPNLMAVLVPRSGLGIKHGIVLGNLVGVIDSDYHGEIQVGIWNRGTEPFTVQPGDRICQMLFVPVVQAELEIVTEFSTFTARGTRGFGHTGRQ